MKKLISRRNFLKVCALAGSAAAGDVSLLPEVF